MWRLRTGAGGVGAYDFWRYRMPSQLALLAFCILNRLNNLLQFFSV